MSPHYKNWLKKILNRAPRPKGWEFWDDLANEMSWNLRRPKAFQYRQVRFAEFVMRKALYEALRERNRAEAIAILPPALRKCAQQLIAVKRRDAIKRRHITVVRSLRSAAQHAERVA